MARPSKYTPELRRRAVEEVLDRDRKVGEVAASLGIASRFTMASASARSGKTMRTTWIESWKNSKTPSEPPTSRG